MLSARGFRVLTLAVFTICLQAALAGAQTTSGDVGKKAAEVWDTLKAYGADKKQEAVAYGNRLMAETDSKISQLEESSAKASGEARAEFEKEIKNLKSARARAAGKLDEMKKASGSAWDATKKGFAEAYKEMQQAYGKATGRFK